jgi:hypothetical protein
MTMARRTAESGLPGQSHRPERSPTSLCSVGLER